MTNQIINSNNQKQFDLEKRTLKFGEEIIDLVKGYRQSHIIKKLMN